jgi:HEPN domain-containing protein
LDDKVAYWLELAAGDLDTASAMLQAEQFLYVGFTCHQIIEKALKAVVVSRGETPQHNHNLGGLAELSGLQEQFDPAQKALLTQLEALNIESEDSAENDLLYSNLDAKDYKKLLQQTRAFYEWIKATL